MENITSAAISHESSTRSESGLSRRARAVAAACGNLLLAGLKGSWRAYTDPNTCSMYWIGTHPSFWGANEK